jgi:hypothetical protein
MSDIDKYSADLKAHIDSLIDPAAIKTTAPEPPDNLAAAEKQLTNNAASLMLDTEQVHYLADFSKLTDQYRKLKAVEHTIMYGPSSLGKTVFKKLSKVR